MESPDVMMALDSNVAFDDAQNFAANLATTLAQYFKIGGCLDELRMALYQVSDRSRLFTILLSHSV